MTAIDVWQIEMWEGEQDGIAAIRERQRKTGTEIEANRQTDRDEERYTESKKREDRAILAAN